MNRIKGLALGLGVATLIVVGLACGGGGNDEPPASADFDAPPAADPSGTSVAPPAPAGVPTPKETSATDEPAADSTEPPVTSASVAAREMIRCFPTGLVARVGASVGDSWTLAGNIRLQGKIPGPPNELRDRSAESSVTFTLTGLDDGGMNQVVDEATGKRARIENSVAYAHVTTVYRDDEGNILEGTDRDEDLYNEALAAGFGTGTIAIQGDYRQALLTTDWDCHRNAWLTGGQPSSGDYTREYSVEERTLTSGRDVVLFTKTVTSDVPDAAGDEVAAKSVYGYDKVTGRLVLTERHQSGTFDDQPYTLDIVREWVPALNLSGISGAPPALAPAVMGMIAPNLRLTF
jgi:hypothetical protein